MFCGRRGLGSFARARTVKLICSSCVTGSGPSRVAPETRSTCPSTRTNPIAGAVTNVHSAIAFQIAVYSLCVMAAVELVRVIPWLPKRLLTQKPLSCDLCMSFWVTATGIAYGLIRYRIFNAEIAAATFAGGLILLRVFGARAREIPPLPLEEKQRVTIMPAETPAAEPPPVPAPVPFDDLDLPAW